MWLQLALSISYCDQFLTLQSKQTKVSLCLLSSFVIFDQLILLPKWYSRDVPSVRFVYSSALNLIKYIKFVYKHIIFS
jgi:hypothetical protein